MTTSERLIAKYGDPRINTLKWESKNMTRWVVPIWIGSKIPALPNRIYCNKDLVEPLNRTFIRLIELDLHHEIETFDGIFNIRTQRGSTAVSIHSFGLAIDLNSSHNPYNTTKEQALAKGLHPFSDKFIACFRENGWTCGADFKNHPDLMHFEHTNN